MNHWSCNQSSCNYSVMISCLDCPCSQRQQMPFDLNLSTNGKKKKSIRYIEPAQLGLFGGAL